MVIVSESALAGRPASIKFSVLAFAGAPQASNFPFWHLRESRKHQILRFGVCGSPASIKFFVLAFAGIPQTPRRSSWYLRESRKRHREAVGICGNPANATEKRLVFAGIPQAPRRSGWYLRESRKRRNFRIWHLPHSCSPLCAGSCEGGTCIWSTYRRYRASGTRR